MQEELFESVEKSKAPFSEGEGQDLPQKEQKDWYVDLTREEFIAFRMLLARLQGPLRLRIPTMIMAALCCVGVAALAVVDWLEAGKQGWPDPTLLVTAALVLLPGFYTWFYVPAKMKKTAGQHYDRSVRSGMSYCGRLEIYPDRVDKVGVSASTSAVMDQGTLFIETADMMVFTAAGTPALVLPGRCLTAAQAAQIRQTADRLPPHNRRFIARVRTGAEVVAPPVEEKPEELWVSTFTYTPEEYATVLKGVLIQHFWRMAPLLMGTALVGSYLFRPMEGDLTSCIPLFLVMCGIFLLFNLILPLARVKRQVPYTTAHDRTMQVRLDTMALRLKLPKGAENWVLWCDVDHVYDKDDFVEVVHNKKATLHIPKRCIEDLEAFDAIVTRCRQK
ncbi:MAG: hypothetical protein E7527_07195 [Ruminococcaceae bacterium]|nr:hypothetical protein [Oscillospiraceae bacterium]